MMKFMKIHITLNYTIDKNDVSSDYTGSIYDEVIEESSLRNKLLLVLEIKKREHEVMIINNRRK